jgi:guanylate kinase
MSESRCHSSVLLLVAGPAGSGKTTLCERLRREYPGIQQVVTTTTRAPRPGEVHGRDYYFFSLEEFDAALAEDRFYEHALVHGRRYGVLKSEIDSKLEAGNNLLLNVDVQGAEAFRQSAKSSEILRKSLVTVFIMPASLEQLRERLQGRGTDDEEEIARRLAVAESEMTHAVHFHHVIRSNTREEDYARLRAIYDEARLVRKGEIGAGQGEGFTNNRLLP